MKFLNDCENVIWDVTHYVQCPLANVAWIFSISTCNLNRALAAFALTLTFLSVDALLYLLTCFMEKEIVKLHACVFFIFLAKIHFKLRTSLPLCISF